MHRYQLGLYRFKLMPTYAGTGFNNMTMVYPDFGASVYYIREESLDET